LSSIKGYTSTLLADDVTWSEEKQQAFLLEIDEEADRLNRLIGDLLDMSRLEAGMLKLEKKTSNIADFLRAAELRLINVADKHPLKLKIPKELPLAYIDEMRIEQVLINLVENAARYSRRGKPIKIEVEPSNNQILISVIDEGIGIRKDQQEKVFEKFYSCTDVSKDQRKGLGLGLSICRGIVRSHEGTIWVESKVGVGSKFSFNLPIKY
jgi:two-component system sensor histidine kinase KdpD